MAAMLGVSPPRRYEVEVWYRIRNLFIIYYYLFAIKHTIIKYTCKNYKNRQDNKAFSLEPSYLFAPVYKTTVLQAIHVVLYRWRGRPRTAWIDNIKTWSGLSVEESVRMSEDRDKWMVWPTLGSRTAKRTEQSRWSTTT